MALHLHLFSQRRLTDRRKGPEVETFPTSKMELVTKGEGRQRQRGAERLNLAHLACAASSRGACVKPQRTCRTWLSAALPPVASRQYTCVRVAVGRGLGGGSGGEGVLVSRRRLRCPFRFSLRLFSFFLCHASASRVRPLPPLPLTSPLPVVAHAVSSDNSLPSSPRSSALPPSRGLLHSTKRFSHSQRSSRDDAGPSPSAAHPRGVQP